MPAPEQRRRIEAVLHGGGGAAGRLLRVALIPAELGYRVLSRGYHRVYDRGWWPSYAVAAPVISVGNLAVGGAGKTPFVAWLVGRLLERRRSPAVLHGGYAPDEPALHRAWHPGVPVFAQKNRLASAGSAISRGTDVLVLDDGFQHRRLDRDLDIVLIAAESWTRRRHLLPRGPWREPLSALHRADLAVVTRKAADPARVDAVVSELNERVPDVPAARAALLPAGWTGPGGEAAPPEGESLAVSGVAGPDLFVRNAVEAGARVVETLTFPDHHGYDRRDARRIMEAAAGRPVVTTAKDAIKLAALGAGDALWVLRQRVEMETGQEVLERMLDEVLA